MMVLSNHLHNKRNIVFIVYGSRRTMISLFPYAYINIKCMVPIVKRLHGKCK